MRFLRGSKGWATALFASAAMAAAGMLAMSPGAAVASVTQGQVDDFEDGTLLNWHTGSNTVAPESNVSSGGPAGANDNYMLLQSNGGGAGGKMVVFNDNQQWSGDFLAAHVDEIQMQVNLFSLTPPAGGPNSLDLRLILIGTTGTLATVSDVLVTPGSGWSTVHFPLGAANLTGGSTSILSSIMEVDLVHSATPIFTRQSSPPIVAQLGVDNIRAVTVPEPGTAALLAAGAVTMSMMKRGRRRARGGMARR